MAMCLHLCSWVFAAFTALMAAMTLWPAPQRLVADCPPGRPLSGPAHDPQGRELDIVVHGATGFTGELVARYLAKHPAAPRFAIAGRSQAKLDALARRIEDDVSRAGGGTLPRLTIIADAGDAEQLAAMANRTKVVLAAAGPYSKYGDLLIRACSAVGTHYADLSGEAFWERRVIDDLHEEAQRSGAKLVHSAGFDSVPFDLGVQITLRELEAAGAKGPISVTAAVTKMGGGMSGGTLDSIKGMAADLWAGHAAGGSTITEWDNDPYLLAPGTTCRVDGQVSGWGPMPRYDRTIGAFGMAHFMAAINARVVRRSFELLGQSGVAYTEGMTFGALWDAVVRAAPFVLSGEMKLLPSPGEGPPLAKQLAGSYEALFVGIGHAARVEIDVAGAGDPGYRHTSKLFAEVGICLADRACHRQGVGGGVLTPLVALDRDELEQRLRTAVHEDGSPLLTYKVKTTGSRKAEL